MRAYEFITEKWSQKYKSSINCSNPKGFSQRAHCQGRKKNEAAYPGNIGIMELIKFFKEYPEYKSQYNAIKEKQGSLAAMKFALEKMKIELVGEPYVSENFADGKVKGKSRPGRVKRAGASCNGSVTDLRKRAKNASGEKAKMYHWCANMKSGRNKK